MAQIQTDFSIKFRRWLMFFAASAIVVAGFSGYAAYQYFLSTFSTADATHFPVWFRGYVETFGGSHSGILQNFAGKELTDKLHVVSEFPDIEARYKSYAKVILLSAPCYSVIADALLIVLGITILNFRKQQRGEI